MHTILPIQSRFDKAIPDNFGNAEYRAERELLIAIDHIITNSGIEKLVIEYFWDVAYVNKYISALGTDKSPRLTSQERDNVRVNAVLALRAAILRKRLGVSLRKFALALSHSDLYKWFCGINRFAWPKIPGKSTIGELENSLPAELIEQVERLVFQNSQDGSSEVIYEPIDFSQAYIDSTCISANIHYPVDWLLLRDSTRTLMKAIARIRKLGLCNRMPYEPAVFISKMNSLCIQMTHAKRKKGAKKLRKAILRQMKKLLKTASKHAARHVELLEKRWQDVDINRAKAEQILKQISNVNAKVADVIRQAHERIIGERKVRNEDKIFSLYEDDVRVITRRKAGSEVEFGNTLFLAEQNDGLIIDWKLFRQQAPSDSKLLKASHKRISNRIGIDVKLISGDRGFDSKANQLYLKSCDIFNAVCPRNPGLLQERLQEEDFRDAQNRRSQTEGRIGILSNCFCGNPMRQKGFEHRKIHMGLSVLSHNLWVLARLKLAQEAQQKKAA